MARRNIRDDQLKKYDLGNNFIRKGSGLARTPPRRDQESYSPPAQDQMKIVLHTAGESSEQPDCEAITWPSRVEQPSKQSPLTQPNFLKDQPLSVVNRKKEDRELLADR